MLIETHAHLDYPDFVPDFADVLRRAADAGVTRIVTIGTSLESSRRAIALVVNASCLAISRPTTFHGPARDRFLSNRLR